MRTRRGLVVFASALGVWCQGGPKSARPEAEEPEALSITHFTHESELFVEFPPLVVGRTSRFAVHLTKLADFEPVTQGRVIVVLSGGGSAAEQFEVAAPRVAGIYGLDVVPRQAGERSLAIALGGDRHDLGAVRVHWSLQEALRAAPGEEAGGSITYLKEQQWRGDFATEPVGERSIRTSVSANGLVRARPDGEARLTSPVAGRLVTAGEAFPRIGMDVAQDQALAVVAPRLGSDADLASLELAASRAQIDLERARRERERLEALLGQGAVPERRVVDARHEESLGEAELGAARRRLAQYHGTQRSGGSGAGGRVAVRSPIAGTIVQVLVAPGAFVEEGEELFRVVDLDRLWLEVQIPEADIARVRQASGAWFEVEGFDRPFDASAESGGRIVALGGVLDPETRTAPLLFELQNPGRDLRVGMFARVHVVVGDPVTAIAIPTSAIVDEAGQDVAYVQIEGESFERRVLRLGARDRDHVQVLVGLATGERVVTRGAYSIRLASSSGIIPAHGHVH